MYRGNIFEGRKAFLISLLATPPSDDEPGLFKKPNKRREIGGSFPVVPYLTSTAPPLCRSQKGEICSNGWVLNCRDLLSLQRGKSARALVSTNRRPPVRSLRRRKPINRFSFVVFFLSFFFFSYIAFPSAQLCASLARNVYAFLLGNLKRWPVHTASFFIIIFFFFFEGALSADWFLLVNRLLTVACGKSSIKGPFASSSRYRRIYQRGQGECQIIKIEKYYRRRSWRGVCRVFFCWHYWTNAIGGARIIGQLEERTRELL